LKSKVSQALANVLDNRIAENARNDAFNHYSWYNRAKKIKEFYYAHNQDINS